jgi:hypothetical protein
MGSAVILQFSCPLVGCRFCSLRHVDGAVMMVLENLLAFVEEVRAKLPLQKSSFSPATAPENLLMAR